LKCDEIFNDCFVVKFTAEYIGEKNWENMLTFDAVISDKTKRFIFHYNIL